MRVYDGDEGKPERQSRAHLLNLAFAMVLRCACLLEITILRRILSLTYTLALELRLRCNTSLSPPGQSSSSCLLVQTAIASCSPARRLQPLVPTIRFCHLDGTSATPATCVARPMQLNQQTCANLHGQSAHKIQPYQWCDDPGLHVRDLTDFEEALRVVLLTLPYTTS